jgi:glycerol-3-phosphate dehydrogenase
MVPQSAVDEIAEDLSNHHLPLDLIALGLRSRIGKGTCQGSFCGARIVAYLYERLKISGDSGIHTLKNFLRNRWRGEKAILWNHQLAQSELSEAIQCGFLSLESVESKTRTVSLAPVAKQGPALT